MLISGYYREVLTSGYVYLVASYAACSILSALTQWGATLVMKGDKYRELRERHSHRLPSLCVYSLGRDSASSDASWHPGARPLHAIPVPHTALVPTLACRRPCCAPHLVQSPLFLDVARHLPN